MKPAASHCPANAILPYSLKHFRIKDRFISFKTAFSAVRLTRHHLLADQPVLILTISAEIGQNPCPATRPFMKTLHIVFFIRGMDTVILHGKTDQQSIKTQF